MTQMDAVVDLVTTLHGFMMQDVGMWGHIPQILISNNYNLLEIYGEDWCYSKIVICP